MLFVDCSDDALFSDLQSTWGNERKLCVRVIRLLAEIEERRYHLKIACSSMFDLCVNRLEMSEGEAFRRIAAARLVRRFPSLLGSLERNEIHLSNLVLLRKHLTKENYQELVSAASRKTTRQVEQLIASRFPKPDVPSTIRQLPTPKPTSQPRSPAQPSPAQPAQPSPTQPSAAITEGTEPLLLHVAPATCLARPGPGLALWPASAAIDSPPKPNGSPVHHSSERTARIEPLSATRHVMKLSISTGLRDKVEYATDMMRHRNPAGTLEVVMERAFDALIATLEKERFGETERPQKNPRPAKPGHVRRETRREVYARDGKRCTYVDEVSGRRCPARAFLELDHTDPRALGGSAEPSNLRVRCRPHNLHSAEEIFGREHVAKQTHLRQQKAKANAASKATRSGVTPPSASPSLSPSSSSPTLASAKPTPLDIESTAGGKIVRAQTVSRNASPEEACIADAPSAELYRVTTSALVDLGFRESEARAALGVVLSQLAPSTLLSSLPIASVLRNALVALGDALSPAHVTRS